MDAFVVLTKDQYTKLTGLTPSTKTVSVPETEYTLSDTDQGKVKGIYNSLQPFIVKN